MPAGGLASTLERDLESTSAQHRADLVNFRAHGVPCVIVVTPERDWDCTSCSLLGGQLYALEGAPSLPWARCTRVCTCQLAPVALE